MNLSRREFARLLGAAAVAGMPLARHAQADAATAQRGLYDVPPAFSGPGSVSLLHLTDCHAQLLPLYFREPGVNIGVGEMRGRLPHLVGARLLEAAGLPAQGESAYGFTPIEFETAARRYGKVGGIAQLATLVKQLKASRPGALLLDGGDTWQGSATALWTQGQDMVEAAKLLGVDVMTGHWEFTYGMQRVRQLIDRDLAGRISFVAQNVRTQDFGDPVFDSHVLREINGVPCAIIGQAFPYTPIANPRYLMADWSFGIRETELQQLVNKLRAQTAQLVVLLSHNGMDVDLKLASRVRGIDVILGGHTHDGMPLAMPVKNAGGVTLVTNSGSHSKFLGVMDMQVKGGRLIDYRWRLLPVFSQQIVPDPAMAALIQRVRQPFAERLAEPLAVSDGLLWRRGNFNGSWDQLLCDAMMQVMDAPIAFSPGFRWGDCLLPGDTITREHLMNQTAITYPNANVTQMTGATIHAVLEDVADNLFNPDPYLQQGGDMVRVGGLSYTCAPGASMGHRISELRLAGKPIDADRSYRVAGWASVSEQAARAPGAKPIWEIVEPWLRARGGRVAAPIVNSPKLIGVDGNPGFGA